MNPIEQEVREMLRAKVAQAPVSEEPPPVVLRRTRTLRAVNAIGATAAAAAVVLGIVLGAQSLDGRPAPKPPVAPAGQLVPWVPLPADSSAAVVDLKAPAGRPCSANDLSLHVTPLGLVFSPSAENVMCQVDPHAAGFKVVVRDVVVARGELSVTIDVAETAPIVSVDGSKRYASGLVFTWSNHCGSSPNEVLFVVTVPGGGTTASAGADVVPPCRRQGEPSRLTFDAGGILVDSLAPDEVPLVQNLGFTINAPAEIARGGTLVYTVRVFNVLKENVRLAACPNYIQGFQRGDLDHVSMGNRLNCEGVAGQMIPARAAVDFEMRLDVPVDLDPGEWTLFWAPETGPRIETPATSRIRVV